MSNERHLKISIGSELGEKAGIGREYAAAQFHRITSDFFFFFTVILQFHRITPDFFSSLQYFHSFIAQHRMPWFHWQFSVCLLFHCKTGDAPIFQVFSIFFVIFFPDHVYKRLGFIKVFTLHMMGWQNASKHSSNLLAPKLLYQRSIFSHYQFWTGRPKLDHPQENSHGKWESQILQLIFWRSNWSAWARQSYIWTCSEPVREKSFKTTPDLILEKTEGEMQKVLICSFLPAKAHWHLHCQCLFMLYT